MKGDWQYRKREEIMACVLFVIGIIFIGWGFLLVGKTEFVLLIGLAMITISVWLYLAEQVLHPERWRVRGAAVLTSIMGAIILAIYFFG